MYWIEFYGQSCDGSRAGPQKIEDAFPALETAIAEAERRAAADVYFWGKAKSYQIKNAAQAIVHEANVRA